MDATPTTAQIDDLLSESEWVVRLARKLVRDPHEADDLAQETWLAALRRPPRLAENAEPHAWLRAVVGNAARSRRRADGARRDRETGRAREHSEHTAAAPEELLERLETQEQLSALVRELPQEQSEVLLLSFFEGHSLARIARERGIPEGTVRWRKQRGLELLREKLDAAHGGDRRAWLSALAPLVNSVMRTEVAARGAGGLAAGLLGTWFARSLALKLALLFSLALAALLPFVLSPSAPTESARAVLDPSAPAGTASVAANVSEAPADAVSELAAGASREAVPGVTETTAPAAAAVPVPTPAKARFTVVDETGRPVSGAVVQSALSREQERHLAQAMEQTMEQTTVPTASFRFTVFEVDFEKVKFILATTTDDVGATHYELALSERARLKFEVDGPHYGVGDLEFDLDPGADEDLGEVVLPPAGAVSGIYRTRSGAALDRVTVSIGPAELPADEAARLELLERGPIPRVGRNRRGEKGTFHVTGVPEGEYRAYTRANKDSSGGWSEPFQVVAGALTSGVLLEVDHVRAGVDIVVLDATGEPIPKALIELEFRWGPKTRKANSKGRLELPTSKVYAPGTPYRVLDPQLAHRPSSVAPLPSGGQEVVVQLERAQTVERELLLRDADGSAVRDASVQLTCSLGERSWVEVHGSASLRLPEGVEGPFDLTVRAPGFATFRAESLQSEELPEDWTLVLERRSGITGTVFAESRPLASCRIELLRQLPEGLVDQVDQNGFDLQRVRTFDRNRIVDSNSDAEGRFQLHADEDGDLALLLTHPEYADAVVLLADFAASEGLADVELSMDAGGAVAGVARDHLGQPVSRATVALDHPLHPLRTMLTRGDGSYDFSVVPAGAWRIELHESLKGSFGARDARVGGDWVFDANCEVVVGAELRRDLELPDPEGVTIAGRVALRGADLAGLTVYSRASTGTSSIDGVVLPVVSGKTVAVGQDGSFELGVVSGVDQYFSLTVPGLVGTLVRTFRAEELPARFELELVLARLAVDVTVELQDASALLPYVGVRSATQGFKMFGKALPDADGRYGTVLVPAGKVIVSWKGAGGEQRSLELQLAEGEERTVTLD